jgi:hypothetical protein
MCADFPIYLVVQGIAESGHYPTILADYIEEQISFRDLTIKYQSKDNKNVEVESKIPLS